MVFYPFATVVQSGSSHDQFKSFRFIHCRHVQLGNSSVQGRSELHVSLCRRRRQGGPICLHQDGQWSVFGAVRKSSECHKLEKSKPALPRGHHAARGKSAKANLDHDLMLVQVAAIVFCGHSCMAKTLAKINAPPANVAKAGISENITQG